MPQSSPQRLRAALDAQLAALGRPPYDGPAVPNALRQACLEAVLSACDSGARPQQAVTRIVVRHLLDRLATVAPGRSVEVRVPPYAAVQCVEGPRHTRGTPSNVVEMDAATWIALATGRLAWHDAMTAGRIHASGARADVSAFLPLV